MILDPPRVTETIRAELEKAIYHGDIALFEKLVEEHPAILSSKDGNGRTLLHTAAIEANVDAVRVLLSQGSAVDAQDNCGRTPLFLAIYEEILVVDRLPTLRLLLEGGANVHARDDRRETPLHMAAYGEPEIVTLLVNYGADVNAVDNAGETPLHKAVQYPEYQTVRELLRQGAAKNIQNAAGLTPAQIAEERGWTTLVEIFRAIPAELAVA